MKTKEPKPEFTQVAELSKELTGRLTNRHSGKTLSTAAISTALSFNAQKHGMVELIMDDNGYWYAERGSAINYLSTYAVLDGKPLKPVKGDEMVVTSELLNEFMKDIPINPSTGKPASKSKVRSSIQNGAKYGFFHYSPVGKKKSYVGRKGVLAHLDRVYPTNAYGYGSTIDDAPSLGSITAEESRWISIPNEKDWKSDLIKELTDTVSVALQTIKAAEREENLTWKFQGYDEARQVLQMGMDLTNAFGPSSEIDDQEDSQSLF